MYVRCIKKNLQCRRIVLWLLIHQDCSNREKNNENDSRAESLTYQTPRVPNTEGKYEKGVCWGMAQVKEWMMKMCHLQEDYMPLQNSLQCLGRTLATRIYSLQFRPVKSTTSLRTETRLSRGIHHFHTIAICLCNNICTSSVKAVIRNPTSGAPCSQFLDSAVVGTRPPYPVTGCRDVNKGRREDQSGKKDKTKAIEISLHEEAVNIEQEECIKIA
ncbi:uncharacterized protein LOC130357375 [Hyla sarda]|uniref:uncharacterized protein LOC130357375 n=1 Tax=Hyla sarda TaxID=327740 RepID=UPI0024C2E0F7|nr:uncharacterized protein LOC130357375 [Hyla sarda]